MRNKIGFAFVIVFVSFLAGCIKQSYEVDKEIQFSNEPYQVISYALDMAATNIKDDALLNQTVAIGTFEIDAPYDTMSFDYKEQFIDSFQDAHFMIVDREYSSCLINVEVKQYIFPHTVLSDMEDFEQTDGALPLKQINIGYIENQIDSNDITSSYKNYKPVDGGYFYVTRVCCYIYEFKTGLIIDYKDITCINSCIVKGITKDSDYE